MNIINQATNYFKGDDVFEGIVMVNLTCMMVLSALYISVSNNLPSTSSIKMVEVWLLFSFLYPFVIILLQTWAQRIKYSNNGMDTKSRIRIDLKCRVVFILAKVVVPTFGIFFTIAYWTYGFYSIYVKK